VFIVLMVIGAIPVSVSPETVDLGLPTSARAPKFVLRPAQRTVFIGAAAVAFCSFAVLGLFSSVGMLIVHSDPHESSPFIWGLAGFPVLGVSALAQTPFPELAVVPILVRELIGVPVEMAVVVAALYNPSLTLYLLGLAIAGAGPGCCSSRPQRGDHYRRAKLDRRSSGDLLRRRRPRGGPAPGSVSRRHALHSSRSALIVFGAVILAVSVVAARLQASALRH
jgi:hypothetical protein